eukprot:gene14718-18805_t
MGVTKKENPVSAIPGKNTPVDLETVLANAGKVYSYTGNIRINMPSDSV